MEETLTSSSNNIDTLSIEMELISIDISLYIDKEYSILDSVYVRDMIMVDIWTHYQTVTMSGNSDSETYDIITNKDYKSIIGLMFNNYDSHYSTVMLIYTIIRYKYPDRRVIILFREEYEEYEDVELYYVSNDWNGYIPKGYKNICSAKEFMEYTMSYVPPTVEGIVSRWPQLSDYIDNLMEIHPNVDDAYDNHNPIYHGMDELSRIRLMESLVASYSYPIYEKIFSHLPPAYEPRSRRYIDKQHRYYTYIRNGTYISRSLIVHR
jgi:hypothetical protein